MFQIFYFGQVSYCPTSVSRSTQMSPAQTTRCNENPLSPGFRDTMEVMQTKMAPGIGSTHLVNPFKHKPNGKTQ